MELHEFAEKFRLLLLEANKNNTVDDIGTIADSVLESDWDEPITDETFVDRTQT